MKPGILMCNYSIVPHIYDDFCIFVFLLGIVLALLAAKFLCLRPNNDNLMYATDGRQR